MKSKLTDKFIRNLEPAEKRVIYWDQEITGLALRISTVGKKTFYLSYRIHGRERRMKLGTYPILSLKAARDRARIQLAEILRGNDPLGHLDTLTLAEACELWRKQHGHKLKSSKVNDSRIERRILPWAGSRKLSAITPTMCIEFHAWLSKDAGEYEANRCLQLLSAIYNRLIRWEVYQGKNPAKHVTLNPERPRERILSPQEIRALFKSVAQEPSEFVQAAIWLYLLTGTRKNELLRAKWEQLDLERGLLKLPNTKNKRDHFLALPGIALEILGQIPRVSGNPHIFPGRQEGRPLSNIWKQLRRICDRAGLEGVNVHDLRRTFVSLLFQGGYSLEKIGKIVNQKSLGITSNYAFLLADNQREALEINATSIKRLIKESQGVKSGGCYVS